MARISPRELCFQGSSQIGCFSSEWTVRVGYPVLPGVPVNTEIAHWWLQSHAHHWHKTWKAKLFVARVYYSGTFFCLVSHRSIMLNSRDLRDLKILRRGRPLERVFLSARTWTHVVAGKRDSRGHSTTSFSWKFYDFCDRERAKLPSIKITLITLPAKKVQWASQGGYTFLEYAKKWNFVLES